MSGRRLQSAPGKRGTQSWGAAQHRDDSESSSSDDEYEIEMLRKAAKELDVNESRAEVYRGTGFVYDEVMTHHKCDWDPAFPENPKRITEPFHRIQELGLLDRCHRIPLNYATEDHILEGHSQTHLERAQAVTQLDVEQLKEFCAQYDSWYANKNTYEAALAAAGSTLTLVDHILTDKVTNGFALVRPPGHHAMHDEFNGYCTFNNVGLAAKNALARGLNRVLIVDWDVHHGQGIQRMFYDDPRVLYFSIHRYEYGEYWPNLRESDYDYIGQEQGIGFNVNVPLNKTGMTNADYLAVLNNLLLPLAYEYGPDMVLISAGFDSAIGCPEFLPDMVLVSNGLDSAIGDEKGEMLVTPAMFAHLTHHLTALASGRVALILEGGYCIESLTEACALSLRSLLGDPCPLLEAAEEPCVSICETILNAIKALRPHWQCFGHYKSLFGDQAPQFEGINAWPPKPGIEFSTSENRPSTFPIYGDYPQRSKVEIQHWTDLIAKLVAETNLQKAPNRCCYVFDPDMRGHKHISSKSHPERPDRISCIYNKMAAWGLLKRCLDIPSREAEMSELQSIHTEDYLDDISGTPSLTDDELEYFPLQKCYPSVYINQKSYRCALLSCGSVLNVLDAVLTGKAQSGVAIVRPPGHHAECDKAMGFCFFNNVGIAVKSAQKKYNVKRILILDWDVHHGNATQHQFYDDPSVLYISLHRYDNGHFFPGSQEADMNYTGRDYGQGYNVNIPWSYGRMGDSEYLTAFHQIVMPIAYQFAPDLVLVSAGFDAALGDPLGGYRVTPAGYGHMTHMLMGLANGKVILALEGGYNLNSISDSMATCMSVLLGDPCPAMPSLTPVARAMDTIHDVMEIQKSYWSCLKGKVQIPQTPRPKVRGRPSTAPPTTSSKKTTAIAGSRQSKVPKESRGLPKSTQENAKAVSSDASMASLTSDISMISLTSASSDPTTSASGDQQQQQRQELSPQQVEVSASISSAASPTSSSSSSSAVSSSSLISPPRQQHSGGRQSNYNNSAVSPHDDDDDNNDKDNDDDDKHDVNPPKSADGISASPVAGSSKQEDATEAMEGAVGGATGVSQRPDTVEDFLKMQGAQQMYAVTPLTWCPHLEELRPLPERPLNCHDPCSTCGDKSENWVCLVCYKVECSRFVNEHMLYHRLETEHNLTLSYSDISVWCYACDHYVDNEVLMPMKSAAHVSKFGESLPGFQ